MSRKTPSYVSPPPPLKKKTKAELEAQLAEAQDRVKAHQEAYNKADQELRGQKIQVQSIEQELETLRNTTLLEVLTPEVIDAIVPAHSRTSCSDTNKCNAERGCSRCALLEAKSMGYIDFSWSFEIRSRS